MNEEWWPIYKITFTKKQMWWLIENLGSLKIGVYPSDPKSSSGYDVEMPKGRKERRYREPAQNRVLELAAEVESRLGLVMNLMSGWERLDRKFYKDEGGIYWKKVSETSGSNRENA